MIFIINNHYFIYSWCQNRIIFINCKFQVDVLDWLGKSSQNRTCLLRWNQPQSYCNSKPWCVEEYFLSLSIHYHHHHHYTHHHHHHHCTHHHYHHHHHNLFNIQFSMIIWDEWNSSKQFFMTRCPSCNQPSPVSKENSLPLFRHCLDMFLWNIGNRHHLYDSDALLQLPHDISASADM